MKAKMDNKLQTANFVVPDMAPLISTEQLYG